MLKLIEFGIPLRPLLLSSLFVVSSISGCTESRDAGKQDLVSSDISNSAKSIDDPERASDLRNLLEVGDSDQDPVGGSRFRFSDVTGSANVHFSRFSDIIPQRYFLPEIMGGGVAWFDYDGDGQLDLYAVDGCELWEPDRTQATHVNRLFRNLGGGKFVEVTAVTHTGDNRYGQGCAVGDFNADGFPDLYVTNFGRNTLFVNNGDGTFNDATHSSGMGDESWGTSAVWLDADGDGYADLYLVNYLQITRSNHQVCTYGGVPGYCGPGQWEGTDDVLFLSQGDGTFEVAAPPELVDSTNAKGLAIAVADFDSDGRPEIYVANDMASNFLLTRSAESASENSPLYRNVAETAGCAVSGDGRNEASMGVACADFDTDGHVDIFLTHYYQHKNTLYHNLGDLLFEDSSRRARTAATSFETLGFGTVAMDFDLDGDQDLFIANGHVLGPEHDPYEMQPQLLENDGSGSFKDVSEGSGNYFPQRCVGRGVAGGDYDNDGRVDLAVSHLDRPLVMLRNETQAAHNYIGLDLRSWDRVYPSGGRVIATAGRKRWVVPIVGGGSYLSSSDPRIVVGLGEYDGPVDIEVAWPGRRTDVYRGLSPNRYWQLHEQEPGIVVSALADPAEPRE